MENRFYNALDVALPLGEVQVSELGGGQPVHFVGLKDTLLLTLSLR